MATDDEFEPELGRSSARDGKRTASYTARVAVSAGLTAASIARGSRRFDGSRVGRGASIGRLLSSRDRLAGYRSRRAIVKTRLVRLGKRAMGGARAHLRYIQRDGVTREGKPGELYSAVSDRADGTAFLERCDGDRHQFRFIVSAEDSALYDDLKPLVRRLMAQAEQDLGTRLDWVAVDHFNTEHPHSHIALRGVDDRGQNLVIAREYIAHGFRERASELASLDLGPRTTREIEERLRHDVTQERLTAIDRRLLRRMDQDGVVTARTNDPLFQSLEAGRLRALERMELAEEKGGGQWRLARGLEQTLREMGERGDIIRLMQREMTRAGLARDAAIHPNESPLVGRVIMRGLEDELRDRHFLLVDGVDGRGHYVAIESADAVDHFADGSIVRVTPREAAVREADRRIAEVAAANNGRYSVDLHLKHDPGSTEAFAATHVRRLEAMRRAAMKVVREPDGTWRVGPDHYAEAAKYEQRLLRDRPVNVEVLSERSPGDLVAFDGATWLDRELAKPTLAGARDAGFGREVREALDIRQKWLVQEELADGVGGAFRMRSNALSLLARRELLRVSGELANALGKPFVETEPGDRVEGRIVRRLNLAQGRFALIENAREFTLVPWQPVFEKQVGRFASGLMREGQISWQFGRGRGGPQI